MGYYIEAFGTLSYDIEDEDYIVKAVKDLNHQHHLKRGGAHPASGDPYEDKWFSWMPKRYHEDESLNTVESLLEMLGFETTPSQDGNRVTIHLRYNDKTGQEAYFLNAMAPWCEISVDVKGEEWGDIRYWHTQHGEQSLFISEARIDYDNPVEFSPVDEWQ